MVGILLPFIGVNHSLHMTDYFCYIFWEIQAFINLQREESILSLGAGWTCLLNCFSSPVLGKDIVSWKMSVPSSVSARFIKLHFQRQGSHPSCEVLQRSLLNWRSIFCRWVNLEWTQNNQQIDHPFIASFKYFHVIFP